MRAVRITPMAGLAAQVVVLTTLAATVGLGRGGWSAGLAYGLVLTGLLTRALTRAGARGFGPANWVTLTRAILVGAVTALAVDSWHRPTPVVLLVTITIVALLLDLVDGWVARGTGSASALGARFDGEVDAFLILVLSVYVAPAVGAWVLAIGAMRYAFLVAGWMLPWLAGPLPPRYWRKVVAAVQGVVLVVAAAGVLPRGLAAGALGAALALLTESFGRDVVWRWQHRQPAPARVERAPVRERLT